MASNIGVAAALMAASSRAGGRRAELKIGNADNNGLHFPDASAQADVELKVTRRFDEIAE